MGSKQLHMNYIGSKIRLAPFIISSMEEVTGGLKGSSFADLFAGTGAIARRVKAQVDRLIVNDWEDYANVLLKHYLNPEQTTADTELFDQLNALSPEKGFIYQAYCPSGEAGRKYFSDENGQKLDAICNYLQKARKNGLLKDGEFFHLSASLLESADSVANTASVYEAYLKKIKKTAQKPLFIKPAATEPGSPILEVYQEDVSQLVKRIKGDVLYLDPPYNRRQYGSCYHMLNTIVNYQPFSPKGKTGLPPDYNKSAYCSLRKAGDAFRMLIRNADFEYIFLSYNNEGILPLEEVRSVLARYGKYDLATTDYQRYKADRAENRTYTADKTQEYLHILKRTEPVRIQFKGFQSSPQKWPQKTSKQVLAQTTQKSSLAAKPEQKRLFEQKAVN